MTIRVARGGTTGGSVAYNWKTPGVSAAANLPATGNTVNDARLTLDTSTLYVWDGTQWVLQAVFGSTTPPSSSSILPLDGGAPDTVYSLIVDGGAPDTVYTLILDGGAP